MKNEIQFFRSMSIYNF